MNSTKMHNDEQLDAAHSQCPVKILFDPQGSNKILTDFWYVIYYINCHIVGWYN